MFISDYNSLYIETVKLARRLGRPVSEVPQPFQLNELEAYNTALKNEAAETARQEREQAAKETRPAAQ